MGKVEEFRFQGEVPVSKSLLNRCLIAQSYFPELQLIGETNSEDVMHLRRCLGDLDAEELFCGDGGTTLRFLLARLSRRPGRYKVTGSERLMSRPHEDLLMTLAELGTKVVGKDATSLEIESAGWLENANVEVSLQNSSQFASAILLNAWDLPSGFRLRLSSRNLSYSYFQMTVDLLKQLGMKMEIHGDQVFVPANQQLEVSHFDIEPDMSSAFTVAAYGALIGETRLLNFPESSLQPDFYFIEAFKKMGVDVLRVEDSLVVNRPSNIEATDFDLCNNPDLAPVLALMLARADGTSTLSGLGSLVHKESNRLVKSAELLKSLGVDCEITNDTLTIRGSEQSWEAYQFSFDPDKDHRMAMAAGLAKAIGAKIDIQTPEVVNKSYPGFWQAVGL